MSSAVMNLANADWLQERIMKAVQQEIDALAKHEAELAVERIKKEIPAIAARIGIELQSMVAFNRIGTELRISIVERKG